MEKRKLIIIGGGPAGLAAAISAKKNGVSDVLIIERDSEAGGILQQCIHNGFGLTRFKQNLTGPEYAYKFIDEAQKNNIDMLFDTMVLDVNSNKKITAINSDKGVFEIQAEAIILAMGCRERSKGALNIAGTRPSGIFSAGTAQKYININGYKVGKKVVILGSGDIGLIMARRLTLEGARVKAVIEIMPHSSGLRRNIVQCLDDFNIPLYLSHTISEIKGRDRVEGVMVSEVDKNRNIIKGSGFFIECDTILFSVGLIPENELTKKAHINISPKTKGAVVDQTRETLSEGVFACGNVLHVHDLVDFVSEEAEIAGKSAALYLANGESEKDLINIECSDEISYTVPQLIDKNKTHSFKLFFRVKQAYKKAVIEAESNNKDIYSKVRTFMTPGEMEHIILDSDIINKADSKIKINLREIK